MINLPTWLARTARIAIYSPKNIRASEWRKSRYRSGIDDDRGNGSLIQKRGERTRNGSKNGARDRGNVTSVRD